MGITDFIKDIQNSDDATKRKWLVIFSGGTMAVVVALWVVWMGATIPVGEKPTVPPKAGQALEQPGFFSIMAAGVSAIWDDISARLIRKEVVSFEENRNFIADDMGKVPATPLP